MPEYIIVQRRRGSGIVLEGISGEIFNRGAALYLSAVDGRWYLADSDAALTMPMIGVSMERVAAAGQIARIVMVGYVGRGDWAWTRGDPLYVSGTPGVLTQVAPAANIQTIGWAITSNMIYVNPSGFDTGGAGAATKEFFVYVSDPDANLGDHPAVELPDNTATTVYAQIYFPSDLTTVTDCDIIVVSAASGNMVWTVDTDFGEICESEDYNTHSDNTGATTGLTLNDLECLDIKAALTNVAANDLVGVKFIRSGADQSDTIDASVYYLGIRVKYT